MGVLFHSGENVIISNSNDKILRVWNINNNHPPLTFRNNNNRYWILAAYPRLNSFAAGYDNGMLIFNYHVKKQHSIICRQHK